MKANTVYICPVHGVISESEVEGVEIFDCKIKEVHFVLEHIPRIPSVQGRCFQKVTSICVERVNYASPLR